MEGVLPPWAEQGDLPQVRRKAGTRRAPGETGGGGGGSGLEKEGPAERALLPTGERGGVGRPEAPR